ncbi:MAG: type VI secretion system baseplate subunit TssG [Alphaproteobacteria bacterium]|nr:MAG: type VI secretion system baseplate subunit TssG [Alphaproteobacteria bacterium]
MERSHWTTENFINTELFALIDKLLLEQEINLNDRKKLSFEQNLTFANQMTDINKVSIEDDRIIVKSNVLNLLGAYGPIPNIYNELFLDETRNKNHSIKDFLDIFHHKLLVLAYYIHKQNSPELIRHMLKNFAPVDLPNLSLNQYFFQKTKTTLGIVEIVQDFLKQRVIDCLWKGEFVYLEATTCGKLGQRYNSLGKNTLLGKMYYEHSTLCRLELEPMTFECFIEIFKHKLSQLKTIYRAYLPLMTQLKLKFNIKPFKAKRTTLKKELYLSVNSILTSREKNVESFCITL